MSTDLHDHTVDERDRTAGVAVMVFIITFYVYGVETMREFSTLSPI